MAYRVEVYRIAAESRLLTLVDEILLDRIAQIKQELAHLKEQGKTLNEPSTEFTIVDPLMTALGYSAATLHKQDKDKATRTIPDYTLLHGSKKWFLEVKRLDWPLTDVEAAQAVSYAINHGAAWAVLTNGRSWYIYRAHLQKPLPEKRVFCITDLFEQPEAIDVLMLLARASMEQDGLTRAWKLARVHEAVASELGRPNSETWRTLRQTIAEMIGDKVTDADLAEALAMLLKVSVAPPKTEDTQAKDADNPLPVTGAMSDSPAGTWHSLKELSENSSLVTGKKPFRLYIVGNQPSSVNHWSSAVKPIITFLGSEYNLPPLPFKAGTKGKRSFVNTAMQHTDGKEMTAPIEVQLPERTVYIETHWSATDLLTHLRKFQEAVGVTPDKVFLEIAE